MDLQRPGGCCWMVESGGGRGVSDGEGDKGTRGVRGRGVRGAGMVDINGSSDAGAAASWCVMPHTHTHIHTHVAPRHTRHVTRATSHAPPCYRVHQLAVVQSGKRVRLRQRRQVESMEVGDADDRQLGQHDLGTYRRVPHAGRDMGDRVSGVSRGEDDYHITEQLGGGRRRNRSIVRASLGEGWALYGAVLFSRVPATPDAVGCWPTATSGECRTSAGRW